jgi:transposase
MYDEQITSCKELGYPIVYIDESGFIKDALRTHGYQAKGSRCQGVHDWQGKTVVQAIGALLEGSLLTVCLIAGMVNGAVFKAWLAQDLLPKLTTSCVVVMDNATFHKVDGISELIEKAGHQLLYLPPYSPDLNPIEKKWAQVKALRNKLRTNDIDALFKDYSV